MNCKQIREEIDAGGRSDMRGDFRYHLNACPDCRHYSDETAALLGLLKAQPRVEVPTDFEFRLRARMARAQAVTESDRHGFLWKFLPETFSWGQMAAATAALALIVTISTFHAGRDDLAPGSSDVGATIATERVAGPASVSGSAGEANGSAPGIEAVASGSAGAPPVKFSGRSVRVAPASYSSEIPAGVDSSNDIAGIDGSTRLYNPKTKRVLNDRSRFYGAETVSVSMAKPAGAVLTF